MYFIADLTAKRSNFLVQFYCSTTAEIFCIWNCVF